MWVAPTSHCDSCTPATKMWRLLLRDWTGLASIPWIGLEMGPSIYQWWWIFRVWLPQRQPDVSDKLIWIWICGMRIVNLSAWPQILMPAAFVALNPKSGCVQALVWLVQLWGSVNSMRWTSWKVRWVRIFFVYIFITQPTSLLCYYVLPVTQWDGILCWAKLYLQYDDPISLQKRWRILKKRLWLSAAVQYWYWCVLNYLRLISVFRISLQQWIDFFRYCRYTGTDLRLYSFHKWRFKVTLFYRSYWRCIG